MSAKVFRAIIMGAPGSGKGMKIGSGVVWPVIWSDFQSASQQERYPIAS